ncbi:MAG: anaerobic glycerol-3-phosphate dehydrogenase subunit A [Desulfobacteraceae bacterium]|nr:anaerobic glycerol-3-phosphate dehydrogenase subunit A [Desulfobacteraceae bacterium]
MKTQVLIIGGGITGTGLARDLALRGVRCVLVEARDINAGASGGNHGLLHSGARYAVTDPVAAGSCCKEGELLKRLAPHCIETTGGYFVAVAGDDEDYIDDFERSCRQIGIISEPLDVKEALEIEPSLSPDIIAAYRVNDATIDPFRLSLDNIAHARELGTTLLRFHRVVGFDRQAGRIQKTCLTDTRNGGNTTVDAQIVVNATGAWAARVAALADVTINTICSKGSLLVTHTRITDGVINRLRRPGDADILVPGGTVSILGTTAERVDNPDVIFPEIHEIDHIINECSVMVPALVSTRCIRAFCGVRPLIDSGGGDDDRSASRGFMLLDHLEAGVDNFITITGGKLTTYRLMAEKTADLVCRRLGVGIPCTTHMVPLPNAEDVRWTEPGLSPRTWIARQEPDDLLLCECEMVSRRIVDDIVTSIRRQKGEPDLSAIGLRSRVGKGQCQGTICSQQLTAYLYRQHQIAAREGSDQLRRFLQERWRGQYPLLWDIPLVQAELQEAIYCGLFGLELDQEGT